MQMTCDGSVKERNFSPFVYLMDSQERRGLMGGSIRKREADVRRRAESAGAAQRVLEKEIAERKRAEGELRYHLAIEKALVRASRLFTS